MNYVIDGRTADGWKGRREENILRYPNNDTEGCDSYEWRLQLSIYYHLNYANTLHL